MKTLSTRVLNVLGKAGINNVKDLLNVGMHEIANIEGIGKKSYLEIMKIRSKYAKSVSELKVPKRVYKKAVKNLVQEQFSEDVIRHIHKVFVEENHEADKTLHKLLYSEPIEALGYTEFEQFASHAEPKKGAGKEAFALYRLCETITYLKIFTETTDGIMTDTHFVSKMKELMVSMSDVFGKTQKEDVIINSIVPRISTVYGLGMHGALAVAEVLVHTGLFGRKLVTTDEGARDFMVHSKINYNELKELWANSSDRIVQVNKPETTLGRSLVNRSKIQYNQEITEHVAKGLDYILEQEMELILPREGVIDAISLKLFGEVGGEFKETWQKLELKHALSEYDYIMANGGKFYVDATTDSIYRIYCKSNNFSVQAGHWLRQYIEFANKKPLNDKGIKWMKLVMAAKAGWDKHTKEEALAAFEEHQHTWRELGYFQREFSILDNPDRATGYQVEVDAQSQSFQIYGFGSASRELLEETGFGAVRADFRDKTAMVMNHLTGTQIWNKHNLKSCVMNKAYTAGRNTVMWGKQSSETEHLTLVESKRQIPLMSTVLKYNQGLKHSEQLSEELVWSSFSKAMEATAYDAVQIMKSMQSVLKDNKKDSMTWHMPDGAKCEVIFQDTQKKHFKWASAKGELHTLTHSVNYINHGKAYNSIPPRGVQSVDAYGMRFVSRKMKAIDAPFVGVHDGYITHPNDVDDMIEFYKDWGIELVETNFLSHMFYEATGSYIDFQSRNKKDIPQVIELIRNSQYCLWL